MDELARSFGRAPRSYADLHGNKLTSRCLMLVSNEGRRLRRLMVADTDKSCRDLARQGNNQADAVQPDIPPISVER
jgi:hypothetical protein